MDIKGVVGDDDAAAAARVQHRLRGAPGQFVINGSFN